MQPVTLYTFGPMFGVPFVEDRTGFSKAPKGKLPSIDDAGTIVAESTLIRRHLEATRGIDLDAGLTPAQRAIGWALERMLEDHLSWLVIHERWMDADTFARGPRRFFDGMPAPLRPVIATVVRRKIKRTLHLHGISRHAEADRLALAAGDLAAAAGLLGDGPFLFGAAPRGADATLFAFLAEVLLTDIQPKLTRLAAAHPSLRAYVDRMMAGYFPDFAHG